jgi:hypothetical protein
MTSPWSPVTPTAVTWQNDDEPIVGLLVGVDTLLALETGEVLTIVSDGAIWSAQTPSGPVWS